MFSFFLILEKFKRKYQLGVSVFFCLISEGLPGLLGNKGTLAKYRREQGNISQFLGTGEQNVEKLQYENILRECGNMGT